MLCICISAEMSRIASNFRNFEVSGLVWKQFTRRATQLLWLSVLVASCGFQMFTLMQVLRPWQPLASVTSQSLVNPNKFQPLAGERRGLGRLVGMDTSLDALDALKKTNRQLQAQLSSIDWPPLTSFKLNDEVYTLPLTSGYEGTEADWIQPTQPELEYLAGFFDGDGCVRGGGCVLTVGQSDAPTWSLRRKHLPNERWTRSSKARVGLERVWQQGTSYRKPPCTT